MPLTQFQSAQYPLLHRGKVRDSLAFDAQHRLIVVTDRISAFNFKLKTPIPFKGAVLNTLSNFWFEKTRHILPNHLVQALHPNISLVREAKPILIEMVVRGYLAGSMWRAYSQGKRNFSGQTLPDGLRKNEKLPQPLLTPTTKDEDDTEISEAEILEQGLVDAQIWAEMKEKALALFQFGSQYLAQRGLVLVDTKYEFGLLDGKLILIDELHTPDSSRFWDAADYAENPENAEQWDKEFVRLWMLDNRDEAGNLPLALPSDVVLKSSERYQQIYERITGMPLLLGEAHSSEDNLLEALHKFDQ